MSRLKVIPDLSQLTTLGDVTKYVSAALQAIYREFNGRITFVDNVAASGPLTATFPNGSTPVNVMHSLNKVPVGFIVINLNAGISVYQPSLVSYPWTATQVTLQASGAGTVMFYVI